MKKIKKLEEPVIWIQKDKKTVSPAKEMSIKEFSINLQKFIDNHAKGDNIEEYKITTKDVIKYIRPLSFCPNSKAFV